MATRAKRSATRCASASPRPMAGAEAVRRRLPPPHRHNRRYRAAKALAVGPGENDPFRCRRWVSSRLAEVARRPIGKKIAFVQCAAELRRYFLCIQHGTVEPRPELEHERLAPLLAHGAARASDCARDRCRHVADGAARGDGGVTWRPRIEYFSLIVAEGSQNSVRKSRSILILRKKAAR